jgi:hypothetical protein
VNAQYVHRSDDHPTFAALEPPVYLDGGFAEVLFRPSNSSWYAFGLYNIVSTDQPVLDVRLGGASGIQRYESLGLGLGHLLQRNLRVTAEGAWDFQQEATRWTLGFVSAF